MKTVKPTILAACVKSVEGENSQIKHCFKKINKTLPFLNILGRKEEVSCMHHVKITGFLLYFSRSKLPHSSSPELLMNPNPLRWKDFDSHKYLKCKLIRHI